MHPVLITGANGQMGQALVEALGDKALPLGRAACDLSWAPEKIRATLAEHQPRAIINAAAYTAVDKAEEEQARATQVNAVAPAILAEYAKEKGIPFIHFSTDYVFDGSGDRSWREEELCHPLNAYGRTKLEGEKAIMAVGGKMMICRISWVYDALHRNFLTTMLKLGQEREHLNIVSDQVGAPCYAPHIAQAVAHVLEGESFQPGIYHLTNQGEVSWHGFAQAIFAHAKAAGVPLAVKEVQPIPTSEYPTPARRPLNSRLDCSKWQQAFDFLPPAWEEGLKQATQVWVKEHADH